MANVVVTPSPNVFHVGTSISAYPRHARRTDGGPPAGAALETQTVGADGRATFTTLAADPQGTLYAFYASAGGEPRWMQRSTP